MTSLIAGILYLDGSQAEEAEVRRMLAAMRPDGLSAVDSVVTSGPFCGGVLRIEAHVDRDRPNGVVQTEKTVTIADFTAYGGSAPSVARLSADLTRSGANALENANGDFAVAHWDGSRLILIRDHLGVRPLQYVVKPGRYCAFASLPSALLQTGLADRVLDAGSLATYPLAACAIGEATCFKQIKSVRAAHSVRIAKDGRIDQARYWRLPLDRLMSAHTDPDEIAEELRRLLDQAVRRRLPAKGPVASHVSAGLDSSAITVLAARALASQDQNVIGFGYNEPVDESGIKAVDEFDQARCLEEAEPNLTMHGVTAADALDQLRNLDPDTMLAISPEDPEEQALRLASDHGATTMLSGWGGDEVVTWRRYGNLAELFWTGQWRALDTALRRRSQSSGTSRLSIARKAILSESLPLWLRDRIRNRREPSTAAWLSEICAMVPPAHAEAMRHLPGRPTLADSRKERRGWLEHWYLPERLEAFAQRGARHGVQYAFPMLDLDLLRFAVTIPSVLLHEDGRNRAIFRRAMRGVLPDTLRLNIVKMNPLPLETLRQARAKADLLDGLDAMRGNALIERFVDIDGVAAYIGRIRDPDEVVEWVREFTERGDQVEPFELYHKLAVALAWYLHAHGTTAE
ncbi:MAG: asparagine synthase-related protein [Pseudomonadota bacterium]